MIKYITIVSSASFYPSVGQSCSFGCRLQTFSNFRYGLVVDGSSLTLIMPVADNRELLHQVMMMIMVIVMMMVMKI